YRVSTSSSVRPDVLINLELAAVQCHDIDHCVKSRAELLRGLARGIGATAAHELGHQAGFGGFALDSDCNACYDGHSATSPVHFFGTKHWSARALAIMKHVLPPAPRGDATM